MKARYRLTTRGIRGSTFYCVDTQSGKRTSLQTKDRDAAKEIVLAKNQALRKPQLNLQLAKTYLAGSDSGVASRTWQNALEVLVETKHGPTKERWLRAANEKPLDLIRNKVIIETQAEHLLDCIKTGTVSTNVHLRRLHNFCLSMNWLPWPLIPKRLWPEIKSKDKRAITLEEHQRIAYRYAWAERARKSGYPERFAQEALGHNSKAVHRSYAKRAQVRLPSLEKYERSKPEQNVIPINVQEGTATLVPMEAAQGN
jgi:hypothetical protein